MLNRNNSWRPIIPRTSKIFGFNKKLIGNLKYKQKIVIDSQTTVSCGRVAAKWKTILNLDPHKFALNSKFTNTFSKIKTNKNTILIYNSLPTNESYKRTKQSSIHTKPLLLSGFSDACILLIRLARAIEAIPVRIYKITNVTKFLEINSSFHKVQYKLVWSYRLCFMIKT